MIQKLIGVFVADRDLRRFTDSEICGKALHIGSRRPKKRLIARHIHQVFEQVCVGLFGQFLKIRTLQTNTRRLFGKNADFFIGIVHHGAKIIGPARDRADLQRFRSGLVIHPITGIRGSGGVLDYFVLRHAHGFKGRAGGVEKRHLDFDARLGVARTDALIQVPDVILAVNAGGVFRVYIGHGAPLSSRTHYREIARRAKKARRENFSRKGFDKNRHNIIRNKYCLTAIAAFDGLACTASPKLKRHSPKETHMFPPLWSP